jgi:hypothetical protein
MKLRLFMRSTACVITAMTVAFVHPALAQEIPQMHPCSDIVGA